MQKSISVKIENLIFKFPSKYNPLFDNLSVEFDSNKIHFIRGRNGEGKSTFFRILLGKISSSDFISGKFSFNDAKFMINSSKDFASKDVKKYFDLISLVRQDFDKMLAPTFSFEENLSLSRIGTYPALKFIENKSDIPHFIKKFDIPLSIPVKLLSGGQRQILAVLMSLQKNPKFLLLDEPTAALDNQNSLMVMNFLKELINIIPITIIIISHDVELVNTFSTDYYFELSNGKMNKKFK